MRGRPSCLLQSAGGEANRILFAFASSSMRIICQNKVSRRDWIIAVSLGCFVSLRTSSFRTNCACHLFINVSCSKKTRTAQNLCGFNVAIKELRLNPPHLNTPTTLDCLYDHGTGSDLPVRFSLIFPFGLCPEHVSFLLHINPLDAEGNYSATSNNAKLVHWRGLGRLWPRQVPSLLYQM